jgi:hypothetical protein
MPVAEENATCNSDVDKTMFIVDPDLPAVQLHRCW